MKVVMLYGKLGLRFTVVHAIYQDVIPRCDRVGLPTWGDCHAWSPVVKAVRADQFLSTSGWRGHCHASGTKRYRGHGECSTSAPMPCIGRARGYPACLQAAA